MTLKAKWEEIFPEVLNAHPRDEGVIPAEADKSADDFIRIPHHKGSKPVSLDRGVYDGSRRLKGPVGRSRKASNPSRLQDSLDLSASPRETEPEATVTRAEYRAIRYENGQAARPYPKSFDAKPEAKE